MVPPNVVAANTTMIRVFSLQTQGALSLMPMPCPPCHVVVRHSHPKVLLVLVVGSLRCRSALARSSPTARLTVPLFCVRVLCRRAGAGRVRAGHGGLGEAGGVGRLLRRRQQPHLVRSSCPCRMHASPASMLPPPRARDCCCPAVPRFAHNRARCLFRPRTYQRSIQNVRKWSNSSLPLARGFALLPSTAKAVRCAEAFRFMPGCRFAPIVERTSLPALALTA